MEETSFSAKQILLQGIFIEKENARLYNEWADRFRPFNPTISSIFEDLCAEEITHQTQLEELYLTVFGSPANMAELTPKDDSIESFQLPMEYFFVVDQKMANQILEAALKTEQKAYKYYQNAVLETQDPTLLNVYKALANFEEDHVKEIQSWIDLNNDSKGKVGRIDKRLVV